MIPKFRDAFENHPVLKHASTRTMLKFSLLEDIGEGDVSTDGIFEGAAEHAVHLTARSETVLCGLSILPWLFSLLDPKIEIEMFHHDGDQVLAMTRVATFRGDIRTILKVERSALNILMRLSGIASAAHHAQGLVPKNCPAKILDTRKTLPGWRQLDKWAVRVGGAHNHRMGLDDMVLIKDNHIAAAGSVSEALRRAKAYVAGRVPIEVEIDSLDQLDEALGEGPDMILLDNFSLEDLREAVVRIDKRALAEASGGVSFTSIPDIAKTGVDRISMGALTHTVTPADLALDMD